VSAAQLVAQLAAAGTPPELLAAVAQELFAGEIERKVLADRRKNERDRKAKSRVVTGQNVTVRDRRGQPPKVSPKNNIQTPSSPPVEASEAKASSPQPRPWTLPAGVSLQIWTDFLGNRKRKRLGTSDTAWTHFLGDLKRVSSQTGIPPPQLIEQCTAKGWGAIYDPRDKRNERSDRDPTTVAVERFLRGDVGTHAGTG
jgi:hypothetical protein